MEFCSKAWVIELGKRVSIEKRCAYIHSKITDFGLLVFNPQGNVIETMVFCIAVHEFPKTYTSSEECGEQCRTERLVTLDRNAWIRLFEQASRRASPLDTSWSDGNASRSAS